MFPVLSTRSKPLALPLLWERTACWPVNKTTARISDAMRPNIYSSSCSNKRIDVNGQSGIRQNGMYSEPPPKDPANAKAVGVCLEDPSSLFVPRTMASLFSAAEIVFLVTVLSSHESLRSSYQQLIFQTRSTVKNCSLISSASLLS